LYNLQIYTSKKGRTAYCTFLISFLIFMTIADSSRLSNGYAFGETNNLSTSSSAPPSSSENLTQMSSDTTSHPFDIVPFNVTFDNVPFNVTTSLGQPESIGKISIKDLQPSKRFSNIPMEAIEPGTRNKTDIETIQKREQILSNITSDQRMDEKKVQTDSNKASGISSTEIINTIPSPLINTFEGLNMTESGEVLPPDITLAVSEKYVIEMVNLQGGVWTKQGEKLNTFPLNQFFLTDSDSIADPRIIFDNNSKRWFASIMDFTTDAAHVSVSATDDPLGIWFVYKFPFSNCPDYPTIGITRDKFAISANTFADHCNKPRTFTGVQYTVAHKDDLLNGVINPRFVQPNPDKWVFSLYPVSSRHSSSSSDLTMVSVDAVTRSELNETEIETLQGQQQNASVDYVMLVSMKGEIPNINTTHKFLDIHRIYGPPHAEQRTSDRRIDLIDSRIQDVEGYYEHIWLTFHEGCALKDGIPSQSCIRLIQLDTSNKTVLQDFDLSRNGSYLFFPALGIDSAGNLVVIYTMSSKRDFPSLMSSQRQLTDPSNTLDPPIVLREGTTAHTSKRFGDYTEVTADPSDAGIFWFGGQYSKPSTNSLHFWSTFIGHFNISK
jgi:hypothetical protein